MYKDGVDSHDSPEVKQASKATEVTSEELTRALRGLKSGKTGSDDGLVAEMLKTGHGGLIDAIVKLSNSILHDELKVQGAWRETKLKVIFKKGDVELPKNYRPISIIPVLAKLYSSVLYNRMRELIDGQLADEQFGFRKGRGCSDAIHILKTVIEKSAEWGEQLLDRNAGRREGVRSRASRQLV